MPGLSPKYVPGEVYDLLGLPAAVRRCARGEIPSPLATLEAPPDWTCFPPALIPVWLEGSGPGYLGYWKHWFGNRTASYVDLWVEGQRAVEIARTAQQFFSHVIISAISASDGVTPEIRRFAQEVGIENVDEIDRLTVETGDDPLGFVRLPQFGESLPAACVSRPAAYDGGFPIVGSPKLYDPRQEYCGFEYPEGTLDRWPADVERPARLTNDPKPQHFERALKSGKLNEAWLILNSPGWLIGEAREALARLAEIADDRVFSAVVAAWLSVADPESGGY